MKGESKDQTIRRDAERAILSRRRVLALWALVSLLRVTAAPAQMPVTKVRVAEAKMLDAASTLTLVATVDVARRSNVCSEIAGIVRQMPVRQGDRIEAGALLCKLNDDALSLRLVEAKAKLAALAARHQEWVSGTRVEELARLKALLDEAIAEHERWTFEMERIKGLYEGRESHAKEYTDTRANLITAERRRAAAQANYEMGVNGPRKETIAHAGHEMAEQQAVVDRLESDLRKTAIVAPFTGHVVERVAEVGEWVPGGGRIVQLVDLETVLVRADVPEYALPFATVGAAARVQVDALKRSFSGTIRHVIRQGDFRARTFPVEVEVRNHDAVLAGGMFARVTLPAGPHAPVVAVPKDAVVERAGIPHLAMLIPGQQGGLMGVLVPSTVGLDVEDWISVTSANIRPGMRVITHGNERMEVFPMPVEVVDADGNPVPQEPISPPQKSPQQ